MKMIDLRSDTVTQPTEEMREAMARAVVGDDVYGEDPTVNRLQEMSAQKLGKEAGLFVPSGTMGNLVAILAHCGRGDEVILGDQAHTFVYEGGGISALGGVHSHQIPNQVDGTLALADIQAAIRPQDIHQPPTRLVVLENTHNRCGGVALSVEYMRQVGELTKERGLALHIDGARIFNAAVSQGVSGRDLVEPADSVMFCISKGLGAPVGSVLCGSQKFIEHCVRVRKQLGGGMRQAGIIAAAGIVALEKMVDRLEEDHERARRLAQRLAGVKGMRLDPGTPYTNMIYCGLEEEVGLDAADAVKTLAKMGVLVGEVGARRFRLVVHCWITDRDVDTCVEAFGDMLRK